MSGPARVEALTRELSSYAQSKQLDAALEAFATIEREGLRPTAYTYSALINAHVVSADLAGAQRALASMEAAGYSPNIIVFTTLLKGHCANHDLAAARELLESMGRAKPPIRPDARTLNTFMRGCVRVGDLAAARWAFGMLGMWQLTPSETSIVALGRLLSQGLELGALRTVVAEQAARASAPVAHRPTRTANPCLFWERGRCERGLNCKFYHDPSVAQSDAHVLEAAQRDTEQQREEREREETAAALRKLRDELVTLLAEEGPQPIGRLLGAHRMRFGSEAQQRLGPLSLAELPALLRGFPELELVDWVENPTPDKLLVLLAPTPHVGDRNASPPHAAEPQAPPAELPAAAAAAGPTAVAAAADPSADKTRQPFQRLPPDPGQPTQHPKTAQKQAPQTQTPSTAEPTHPRSRAPSPTTEASHTSQGAAPAAAPAAAHAPVAPAVPAVTTAAGMPSAAADVVPTGISLVVYLSDVLKRPRREMVDAVFATGVQVFGFSAADVQRVLVHLDVSSA